MKEFMKKLFASLDNHSLGYSGRKLSAVAGVLTAIYIATQILPEASRIYAVYAFLGFALLCLGLITVPQLIEFLSGKKSTTTETIKTEITNEKTVNNESTTDPAK